MTNQSTINAMFASCQAYYLHLNNSNNTILVSNVYCSISNNILTSLSCCGNCTQRRCCEDIEDMSRNYLNELECINNANLKEINEYYYRYAFSDLNKKFVERVNTFFETLSFITVIAVSVYMLTLLLIIILLFVCSLKLGKNTAKLSVYQVFANKYYFIYKLFNINSSTGEYDTIGDEHCDINELMLDDLLSSEKLNNLITNKKQSDKESLYVQKIHEFDTLHDDCILKQQSVKNSKKTSIMSTLSAKTISFFNRHTNWFSNNKLSDGSYKAKEALINNLINENILIKANDIEKFQCKKFASNYFMQQQVLNIHQIFENIIKKPLTKSKSH